MSLAAPPVVFTPPSAGIPHSLRITGITDPAIPVAGLIVPRGEDQDGAPTWFLAPDWLVNYNGSWNINATGYSAVKAGDNISPVGLTGWNLITGTGQPVVSIHSMVAPPPVITP